MTQLPPKPPSMTQNWPSFHHHMMPMSIGKGVSSSQHPSWVDEFLDFSSARRTSHRRSASDSIAFLPLLEDCPSPPPATANGRDNSSEFERFDDEQIMSMFADDLPSTPSGERNSNGDEKVAVLPRVPQPKEEPQEVDSLTNDDAPPANAASTGETICDPKRVKRILANRQSAQRSRVRKLQYISELERSVTTLQTEVSTLSPRVAFLDHQRLILNVDNSALKQRIAALLQDKIFKDAHQEALKKEIERLRQIYNDQNLRKVGTATPPAASSDDFGDCTDKDQNSDR